MPYLDFEDREVNQKGSINDERESNVTEENVEIEEIDDEIDEDEIDFSNTKLDLGKNAVDFSDIQKKANELKKTTTANVAPTKKAEVDNKTINEINNIDPFNLDDLDDDDDEEEIEEEQEERITEFDVQNRVAEIGRQKSQETKTVERPTINFNADEMNEELEQDERDYEEELQQQELNKGVKKPPRQIKEVEGFQVYEMEDVGEALESYEKDNDFHVVEMADVEKQKDVEPNIYDDSKILESEEYKEIKKAINGDMDFVAEKNRPLDFSSNGSGDQEVQEEGPSTLGKVAGFVGKAALLPFKGIGYFADKVGDSEFLYNEDLHPLVGFGLALLEGLFDCGYALFSAIGGGLSGLFGAAENKVRENGIDLPEGAAEKEAESVKDCKDTFELAKAKLNEKLELCNKGLVSRDQFLNNKKITDFYKNVYGKELSDYFKEIDEKKEKEESKKKEEAEKTKENNNNNNNEVADDKKKEEKVNEAPQVENNNNNPNNDNNTANVTDDKKKEEKVNDEPKLENTESNSSNNNSTDNKKEEKEETKDVVQDNTPTNKESSDTNKEATENKEEKEKEEPQTDNPTQPEPSKARKILGATGSLVAAPFKIIGTFGKTFFKSEFLKEKGMIPGAGIAFALLEATATALITGIPAIFKGIAGLFKAIFSRSKSQGKNLEPDATKELVELNEKSENMENLGENLLNYAVEKDLQNGSKYKDLASKNKNINNFSKKVTGKGIDDFYKEKQKEIENKQLENNQPENSPSQLNNQNPVNEPNELNRENPITNEELVADQNNNIANNGNNNNGNNNSNNERENIERENQERVEGQDNLAPNTNNNNTNVVQEPNNREPNNQERVEGQDNLAPNTNNNNTNVVQGPNNREPNNQERVEEQANPSSNSNNNVVQESNDEIEIEGQENLASTSNNSNNENNPTEKEEKEETKEVVQDNVSTNKESSDTNKEVTENKEEKEVEEPQTDNPTQPEPSKARKILGATGNLIAAPFKMVGAFGKAFFKSEFLKEKGMIPGAGIAFALVEATFAMLLTGVPAIFKGIGGLFKAIFSSSKSQGKNLEPDATKELEEINDKAENLEELGKNTLEYGITRDLEKGGQLQEKVSKNEAINKFAEKTTGKNIDQLYQEKRQELANNRQQSQNIDENNREQSIENPQNENREPDIQEPQNDNNREQNLEEQNLNENIQSNNEERVEETREHIEDNEFIIETNNVEETREHIDDNDSVIDENEVQETIEEPVEEIEEPVEEVEEPVEENINNEQEELDDFGKDNVEKDEEEKFEDMYLDEKGINDLDNEEVNLDDLDKEENIANNNEEEPSKENDEGPKKDSAFTPIIEQLIGRFALDKISKNEDITKGGISKFIASQIKNANEKVVDGNDSRSKRDVTKDLKAIAGNFKLGENLGINPKDLKALKDTIIGQMKNIVSTCEKFGINDIDKLINKFLNSPALKDSSMLKENGLNKDKVNEMEKEANQKDDVSIKEEKENPTKKEESKSIESNEKTKDEPTKSKELSNDEKNIDEPLKENKEENKEKINENNEIISSNNSAEPEEKEKQDLDKQDLGEQNREHVEIDDNNFDIEYNEESYKDAPEGYSKEKQLTNELSEDAEDLNKDDLKNSIGSI